MTFLKIFNLYVFIVIVISTGLAIIFVEGPKKKILAILGGGVTLVLAAYILPSAGEEDRQDALTRATSAPRTMASPEAAPTVGVTLRNYKEKGDSIQLECSGSTGNITCKPKK